MTVRKSYTCSQCDIERKQANHWFVFTRTATGIEFHKWSWAVRKGVLDLADFGHLCGQACAHRLLDDFLAQADEDEPDWRKQ
jgi:hypothetical protein